MKILITIPDEKYHYIKELERGNTDYATTLMLYHAVKYGKPFTIPQGEWIEVKPHQSDLEDGIDYREECSICHEPNRHYGFDEYHNIRFATYYKTNYCPNCGAKMT